MNAQGCTTDSRNLEVVMATTESVLHALAEMDRYVERMAAATGSAEIVDAVGEYLAGWSKERIHNLQKTDAGWAPFDDRQQPVPVYSVADVLRISHAVRSQCVALKESGIVPAPELLELDLFLFLARQIMEDCDLASSHARADIARPSSGRRLQQFGRHFIGSPF